MKSRGSGLARSNRSDKRRDVAGRLVSLVLQSIDFVAVCEPRESNELQLCRSSSAQELRWAPRFVHSRPQLEDSSSAAWQAFLTRGKKVILVAGSGGAYFQCRRRAVRRCSGIRKFSKQALTDKSLVRLWLVGLDRVYGRTYPRVQKLHESVWPALRNSQLPMLMPVANGLDK